MSPGDQPQHPDGASVLMVFDVDGTISRFYREEEYAEHHDDPNWYELLPLDEAVVDELDELAHVPGVDVAWLTSWAPDQDYLDHLINGSRFRGRLAGRCVPWIGEPDKGWRLRSLLAFAEQHRPRALVWADDQSPGNAGQRIGDHLTIPRLVLRPHRNVGLTMDDVHRVHAFVNEHARQQPW